MKIDGFRYKIADLLSRNKQQLALDIARKEFGVARMEDIGNRMHQWAARVVRAAPK